MSSTSVTPARILALDSHVQAPSGEVAGGVAGIEGDTHGVS